MKHSISILLKSPKFMIGAVTFVGMLLLVTIYPLINRSDPLEMIAMAFQPPGMDCCWDQTTLGVISFWN